MIRCKSCNKNLTIEDIEYIETGILVYHLSWDGEYFGFDLHDVEGDGNGYVLYCNYCGAELEGLTLEKLRQKLKQGGKKTDENKM